MKLFIFLLSISMLASEPFPPAYSGLTELQAEVDGHLIDYFHKMPTLTCGSFTPNRLWAEPFGNFLEMENHNNLLGFDGKTGGVCLGYDRQIDNFILGVGGAWDRSHLKWNDQYGNVRVEGLYAGLYADYFYYDFYAGAVFLGGMNFYDSTRNLPEENLQATADFHALNLMGQIRLAYLFGAPEVYFYPYANLDFLYLNNSSFQETGAGAFNASYTNSSSLTLRTEMGLGLQVQDRNNTETICISPKVLLGWVNLAPLETAFPQGWEEAWNLLSVDFSLRFRIYEFSLKLAYAVEFTPDQTTTLFNQNANALLSWNW